MGERGIRALQHDNDIEAVALYKVDASRQAIVLLHRGAKPVIEAILNKEASTMGMHHLACRV